MRSRGDAEKIAVIPGRSREAAKGKGTQVVVLYRRPKFGVVYSSQSPCCPDLGPLPHALAFGDHSAGDDRFFGHERFAWTADWESGYDGVEPCGA